jgi:hypothetical protein
MKVDPVDDNHVSISAAASAAQAFPGATFYEWGIVNVPRGSVTGLYQPNWTSELMLPVVANATYSMSLFARHEFGTAYAACSGTFSVQVF